MLIFQKQAIQYFKQKFPDLEISKDIIELIGIMNQYVGKCNRAAYHEHIGEKYIRENNSQGVSTEIDSVG